MPSPQKGCTGLSYKGTFYVLSDPEDLPEQKTSDVYNLLDGTWSTIDDVWPFSRAKRFSVQVVEDEVIYIVIDQVDNCIRSRDNIGGEWQDVGLVPPLNLPGHPHPRETFHYGFAALKKQLYIIGGSVLLWFVVGEGRFEVGNLGLVRACNPSIRPLTLRETKPMCALAGGSILGCAALEEKASPQ